VAVAEAEAAEAEEGVDLEEEEVAGQPPHALHLQPRHIAGPE